MAELDLAGADPYATGDADRGVGRPDYSLADLERDEINSAVKQFEYNKKIQDQIDSILIAKGLKDPPKGPRAAANKADAAADSSRLADNTIALARAEQLVEAAEAKREGTLDGLTDKIKDQHDAQKALDQEYVKAGGLLRNAENDVRSAEKALDDFDESTEIKSHQFNVSVHAMTVELEKLQKAAASALDPLRADVDFASSTLEYLGRKARDAREEFNDAQDAIEDKFYDLAAAEKAAIAPLDELVATAQAGLTAEEEELSRIVDLYDSRLIPLRERENELNRQQAAFDAAKRYREQGVEIENLVARLATATEAERRQLQIQIDEARKQQGLDAEKAGVGDQISRIEQERDAAVRAQEAQVEAAQRNLEAMQAQRDAAAEYYEKQRENIQAEMDLLARKEELRERQQRDDELRAQKELENAQDVLEARQKEWDGRVKSAQDALTAIQNFQRDFEFQAGEERRIRQLNIDDLQEKAATFRTEYDSKKEAIGEVITALEAEKDKSKEVLDKEVDDAKKIAENLRDAYGIVEKLDSAHDKGAGLTADQAKALGEAKQYIADIVPLLPPYETGFKNVAVATDDAKKKTTDYIDNAATPLKEQMDRTKDGTLAKNLFDVWDPESATGFKKLANTSLHEHGNALGEFRQGAEREWKLATAAADKYLQKLKEIATHGFPPGTPPEGKASGGSITAGKMYIVGENGPELFMSGQSGYIVPSGGFSRNSTYYAGGFGGGGGSFSWTGNLIIQAQRLPESQSEWNRVGQQASIAIQRHMRVTGREITTRNR
jgi:hypothetical protein